MYMSSMNSTVYPASALPPEWVEKKNSKKGTLVYREYKSSYRLYQQQHYKTNWGNRCIQRVSTNDTSKYWFISFSMSIPLRLFILKWILVFVSEENINLSIAFCRHTPPYLLALRVHAYVLYQRFGYEHRRDLSMSQQLLDNSVSHIVHIARTCALHFDDFQRICSRGTPTYSGPVEF